jgi:nucleotide-binding universal stress UspA family protein
VEVTIKNVLVPIGLDTDITIYYAVKDLVNSSKTTLFTLYSVIEIPFATTLEAESELRDTEKYKRVRDKLEKAEKIFRDLGLRTTSRIDFGRDIIESIVEEASSEPYDLIVLVKRRKQPRFLGRSVSRALVARVTKPILILSMEKT